MEILMQVSRWWTVNKKTKTIVVVALAVVVIVGIAWYIFTERERVGKEQIRQALVDPASAVFKDLYAPTYGDGLCGRVNAKNSMGGYTGFKRFYAGAPFTDSDGEQHGAYTTMQSGEAVLLCRSELGDMDVQYSLGSAYASGLDVPRDSAKAAKWYRKAAEQGYAVAQDRLGDAYASGWGVPKDEAKAVQWYRKAAEQGYAVAQDRLGDAYASGWGVPKDEAKAVQWYRKAAEQGHVDAQLFLGSAYEYGRGVPEDAAEAVQWYRKAAEQGDVYAQNSLGRAYEGGSGVPKDAVLAYFWYDLADESGASLAGSMTDMQIAKAQRMVSEWKSKKK